MERKLRTRLAREAPVELNLYLMWQIVDLQLDFLGQGPLKGLKVIQGPLLIVTLIKHMLRLLPFALLDATGTGDANF